ncbi:hypothetical protein [Curtobacterium sp. MCBD17_003]|uniref:hypothetical protein n=1 Tax=Curtobacterium sp. MCBD17_003 TaxID=2175667 RepID=UPI0011B7340A|nr:hypothetical protein [Curtobacterium sp. MCBD17_003]WIE55982.1 hypothetical protein DEI88_007255 [Curtobacterium sp. MCBD17_003]
MDDQGWPGSWIPCVDVDAAAGFLGWVAARGVDEDRHLVRVSALAAGPDGLPMAFVRQVEGLPLPIALDVLGGLTVGVAVTLGLPLVRLAVRAAVSGSTPGLLPFGPVRPSDVLVDRSGAVVVAERPPGASGGPPHLPGSGTESAMMRSSAAGRRHRAPAGVDGLLVACRVVWERADPRLPEVDRVLRALDEARADVDGWTDRVPAAMVAAAVPRPVRWPHDATFPGTVATDRASPAAVHGGATRWGAGGAVRAGAGHGDGASAPLPSHVGIIVGALSAGLPVPGGRRLPLRVAIGVLLGVVGLVTGLVLTGGPRAATAMPVSPGAGTTAAPVLVRGPGPP